MIRVAIALGSNMGDRLNNIRQAVHLLENRGVNVTARSDVFETKPVGVENQKRFLNACIVVSTDMSPRRLLDEMLRIESELGRTREVPMGPRPIDLDILLVDSMVVHEPDLEIPHPRMTERAFVLTPLAQICPEWIHPESGLSVGRLSEAVRDSDPSIRRITSL
mgnify:CR=1 FL=1|jgi:2-amino-4-hydroxy-6-hydroxymethyldihydropteridine diphosphokinase